MGAATRKSGKVNDECVAIFITAPSSKSAEKIAGGALDERLVACASIIEGIRSLFWWEGKKNEAKETLIICKTTKNLVGKLTKYVREHHEYQVPEIIAVPIIGGNPDYLNWVKESTVE